MLSPTMATKGRSSDHQCNRNIVSGRIKRSKNENGLAWQRYA